MLRLRLWSLPLLLLPIYSVASSLQACSATSEEKGAAEPSALTCVAGESAKKINAEDVCCRALGEKEKCRKTGEPAEGFPCATPGATKPGSSYEVTFDVCVEEECDGDRRRTDFATSLTKSTGTLRCVAKSSRTGLPLFEPASASENEWEFEPGATTHEVQRACLVSETQLCNGQGYGSSAISLRRLYLVSSKCGVSGGAMTDCPIGDL